MPAPTFYDLYKFEKYVADGAKTILSVAGISSSYAQQDNANLGTPRVEIQTVLGTPTGHAKLSGSKAYYDNWNVTLNAVVVTERKDGSHATHYDYTGKVISTLGDTTNWNSGSVLPYHFISRATYNGASPAVEAERNKDLSGLNFILSIWIKNDAWPF